MAHHNNHDNSHVYINILLYINIIMSQKKFHIIFNIYPSFSMHFESHNYIVSISQISYNNSHIHILIYSIDSQNQYIGMSETT